MSLETVEREIETRLQTLFESIQGIPVDYGQDGFVKPDTAWVRLVVLGGLDVGLEVNGASFETAGNVEAQIFTKNRRENAQIYDQLAAVFRQATFNGVHTLDPLRIVVGQRDSWWQTNLSVEWEIET